MTITIRPRWSLGRGKTLVPSRWQATLSLRTCALSNPGDMLAAQGSGARYFPPSLRRPPPTRRAPGVD